MAGLLLKVEVYLKLAAFVIYIIKLNMSDITATMAAVIHRSVVFIIIKYY